MKRHVIVKKFLSRKNEKHNFLLVVMYMLFDIGSYEMTWSRCRRLLGLGASKNDKPHDEPCCGNY